MYAPHHLHFTCSAVIYAAKICTTGQVLDVSAVGVVAFDVGNVDDASYRPRIDVNVPDGMGIQPVQLLMQENCGAVVGALVWLNRTAAHQIPGLHVYAVPNVAVFTPVDVSAANDPDANGPPARFSHPLLSDPYRPPVQVIAPPDCAVLTLIWIPAMTSLMGPTSNGT